MINITIIIWDWATRDYYNNNNENCYLSHACSDKLIHCDLTSNKLTSIIAIVISYTMHHLTLLCLNIKNAKHDQTTYFSILILVHLSKCTFYKKLFCRLKEKLQSEARSSYLCFMLSIVSTHLLRRLVLDELEHVLDQPFELLLRDLPVAVHVKHTENPSQSLLCSPVGHDVEDQLEINIWKSCFETEVMLP